MRLPSTQLTGLILCLSAACAMGQTASITSISPDSAVQGATDQLVTFTVTGAILPPVGATPNSVTIGDINGSSVSYASANTITAIFDFPADEAVGAKDAAVVWYPTDGDTITVGSTGGFTVTAAGDTAPGISSQPASQTVAPGDTVSFSITASGTEPMSYEWFKDDVSLGDATTEPSHTIDAAETGDAGTYVCVVTNDFGSVTSDGAVLTVRELEPGLFVMVDTGQATCYSDTEEITAPGPGDSFAGQDAQYAGAVASYTVSDDGLTVYDNHTGLTWIRSTDTDGDGDIDADDKLTYDEQFSYADARNAESFGGYSDWRVPSIKEVYSLMDFRGMDPSGYEGTDTSGLVPFIDDDVFEFAYGDTDAGERIIDSQYGSTNLYVDGEDLLFGVNFADGRIKGYGLTLFGVDKTFFVMLCRGNESYGVNDFEETGEGTVLDHSTGLMWQQGDSVDGLDWEEALAYAENLELGGYSDWRLPNAKELQAIVDYTRSPGTTDSGAIDAVFTCTPITNEAGQDDYPMYWTGTTHENWQNAEWGVYIAFGRAMGYTTTDGWTDIHGAGCQRSDPKSGSASDYTQASGGYYYSDAPQGDHIRIYNHVRCVRGGAEEPADDTDGDGLSDWFEYNYSDSITAMEADGDDDGDSASNEQEMLAGTVPTDAGSCFTVTEGVLSEDGFGIEWSSEFGIRYTVERSSDLTTFEVVAEDILATPPLNSLTISDDGSESARFFRVSVR